jgi:hypothetical protein
MAKNIAFSPLTALGAGGTALYATHNMPGIGAGDTKSYLNRFAKEHGLQKGVDPTTLSAEEVGNLERAAGKGYNPRVRRMAGLSSDVVGPGQEFLNNIPKKYRDMTPGLRGIQDNDEQIRKLKGFLSTASRKHLASTFGQSGMRGIGRGTLGAVAAGVPALIGAFLTREADT